MAGAGFPKGAGARVFESDRALPSVSFPEDAGKGKKRGAGGTGAWKDCIKACRRKRRSGDKVFVVDGVNVRGRSLFFFGNFNGKQHPLIPCGIFIYF